MKRQFKRYLLFYSYAYHLSGGLADCFLDTDDEEEVKREMHRAEEIFDRVEGVLYEVKLVASKRPCPHCGAVIGKPCTMPSGRKFYAHEARKGYETEPERFKSW